MTTEEYKSKEALLYLLYENIEKVCYNRFILSETDNKTNKEVISIIDVDNTVLRKSSDKIRYSHSEELIIEITQLEKNVHLFGESLHKLNILDYNLEVKYSKDIILDDRYYEYPRKEAWVRRFGQFILIETASILILLDSDFNLVIDEYILHPLKHKIWFNNGYHMYISLSNDLSVSLELITNYSGDEIVSYGKIELEPNICKVFTKLGDSKKNTHVSLEVFDKLCSNSYNDIGKIKGVRDGYAVYNYINKDTYVGCILKDGTEIISPRKNVNEIKQISQDLFMVVYSQDDTNDIEIISKTKGIIIKRGIVHFYDQLLSRNLPIFRFYAEMNGTLFLFVLGNDNKLYSIQNKAVYTYTVEDISNAFNIRKLTSDRYMINLYGQEIEIKRDIRL